VYTRKRDPIKTLRQEQFTELTPGNEVTICEPNLNTSPVDSPSNSDLDLPIAVRKQNRECSKRPLYPLSHFVTFKKFSPSHQSFLSTLNTIPIPNSLSKALSKKEWRLAMEA